MNRYFLAIDIGNTQISFGFFYQDDLLYRFDYLTHQDKSKLIDQIINDFTSSDLLKEGISDGLIGSVVPSMSLFIKTFMKDLFGIDLQILDNKVNLEVDMNIDNPLELGADLLADIIAAKHQYKCPLIIVDLGTVSKYIVVDKYRTFIGTSFYPGVKGSLVAMGQDTALLPKMDKVEKYDHPYGKNTVDSMLSGIYFGTVSSVRGITELINKEFDNKATFVLTGGYSNIVYEQLTDFIFDKDLTLKGIYLLHKGER